MKKVLTVIISGIAIGLIAGLVMLGVNIFAVKTGIIANNAIVSGIENLDKNASNNVYFSVHRGLLLFEWYSN